MKPGDILGPYRVVSALGAGGMGEVYRATDTILKRQVAVKLLPEAVAELRFFGGLSLNETAHGLRISMATVERDWQTTRAWLQTQTR